MSVSVPSPARNAQPWLTAVGSALLTAFATAGCSAIDPATDTCLNYPGLCGISGIGGAGGSEMPPPDDGGRPPTAWGCLFEPPQPGPPPPTEPGARVNFVIPIADFDSQPSVATAVPGLNITVCKDPGCAMPAVPPEVTIVNEPPGTPRYVISFPYNFSNGSLRLTAPNYVPMDYPFGGPMVGPPEGGNTWLGLAIGMLTTSRLATLYENLGLTTVDLTRGVLALRTLNCLRTAATPFAGVRASDVRVEVLPNEPAPPAVGWSLSNGNVATPNVLITDERGVVGFANVPAPFGYRVRAIAPVGPEGEGPGTTPYPSNGLGVQARPGVITLAEIRPSYAWGQ